MNNKVQRAPLSCGASYIYADILTSKDALLLGALICDRCKANEKAMRETLDIQYSYSNGLFTAMVISRYVLGLQDSSDDFITYQVAIDEAYDLFDDDEGYGIEGYNS